MHDASITPLPRLAPTAGRTLQAARGDVRPRRRGRPRDVTADERILEAAGQLILERGFDKVTVDDVAALARAGKATVYRRWASKEDLAVAALEQLYHQELPVPDTGSVREDLLIFYRHVLEFANTPHGLAYIRMTMTESLRDPRVAQLYQAASRTREELIEGLLRRGVERGELQPDLRVDFAVNWVNGLLANSVVNDQPLPRPEDADDMVDFLLSGIGA